MREWQIMRRFLCISILCLGLFFASSPTVLANEAKEETDAVSDLFINFMDEAFEDPDQLLVVDYVGNDVTGNFLNDFNRLYNNGDYKGIQDIIKAGGVSVSIYKEEEVSSLMGQELASDIRGKSVSRQFYHMATDTKNKFTKEWVVTLYGSYSYNIKTNKITAANSPTIALTTASWGALWSPRLDNISTSNNYSGSTVNFSAKYTMRGTLGVSVGNLPINFDYNFGRYTDKFSTGPNHQ
jgi:hypothetical protein